MVSLERAKAIVEHSGEPKLPKDGSDLRINKIGTDDTGQRPLLLGSGHWPVVFLCVNVPSF